jgi:hypothetical protein
MSKLTTLQKAKKILNSYDDIEPRKCCVQPYSRSKSKSKRELSYTSSASKSASNLKRDFSFCKGKNKLDSSIRSSSSCLKEKKPSNASFVSAYNKESRYDKIMRLKVKPKFNEEKRNDRTKKSVLSNSFSSIGSRDENQENKSRNKFNRLEKIMQIKVVKPKVNSTLTYYQPKQGSKSKQL